MSLIPSSHHKKSPSHSVHFFILLGGLLLFFIIPQVAFGAGFEEIKPRLQIPVPNLQFSELAAPDEAGFLTVNYLPEYIAAVYSYLVGIAGLIAIAMIMYGGSKWVFAAGDAEKISVAKEVITHALIGLVLSVGSYIILYTINPALVRFDALRVKGVPQILYEEAGDTETSLTGNAVANARALDIDCPQTGGIEAVSDILNSMSGKVAYRFGGKGGPPPYSEKPEGAFAEFNTTCPDGNLCLDCSGFINFVYRCAGISAPGGGTDSIFGNAERITEINVKDRTINGSALNPGDLLGWRAGEEEKAIGHVIMYIGDGLIAESKGGRSGREGGANPRIVPLERLNYPLTTIRRAPE